jgi:uncharacterized phage protein (TIGR02218 family)
MSFDDKQASRSESVPFSLFHFQWGPGVDDVYLYTNAERPIQIGGDIYTSIPIKRGKIKRAGGLDRSTLNVEVPGSSEIASLFKGQPPSQVVNLTIYKGELDDPSKEVRVVWVGRVLGSTVKGQVATLRCEPVSTMMRRPGLRRHYQYGCPHVLYGSKCKADKAAATRTTTVQSVNGAEITLPGGWNGVTDQEKFVGGYATWTNPSGQPERLSVVAATNADVVILENKPRGLAAGDSIQVLLGCNHTLLDCRQLHNNALNYGGHPWIPTENPVGIKNNFY